LKWKTYIRAVLFRRSMTGVETPSKRGSDLEPILWHSITHLPVSDSTREVLLLARHRIHPPHWVHVPEAGALQQAVAIICGTRPCSERNRNVVIHFG